MLASRTDYDQLAETIRAKAKDRGRIFVAVDGPGASGKALSISSRLPSQVLASFMLTWRQVADIDMTDNTRGSEMKSRAA